MVLGVLSNINFCCVWCLQECTHIQINLHWNYSLTVFSLKKLNKIGHPSHSSDPLSSVVISHNFTFSKVIALGILWFNYTYVSTYTCTGTLSTAIMSCIGNTLIKKIIFYVQGIILYNWKREYNPTDKYEMWSMVIWSKVKVLSLVGVIKLRLAHLWSQDHFFTICIPLILSKRDRDQKWVYCETKIKSKFVLSFKFPKPARLHKCTH